MANWKKTLMASAGGGPTEIGQEYGGGYYAGKIIDLLGGSIEYYIILAPKNTETTRKWYNTNVVHPGACITTWNGQAASAALNSATGSNYPAAQYCENLSSGGYTDWYLPARDEILLCYNSFKPTTTSNATGYTRSFRDITNNNPNPPGYPYPDDNSTDENGRTRTTVPPQLAWTATVPPQTPLSLFQSGGAQAFATTTYWTSSLVYNYSTWLCDFGNGYEYDRSGNQVKRVRAVRREPV